MSQMVCQRVALKKGLRLINGNEHLKGFFLEFSLIVFFFFQNLILKQHNISNCIINECNMAISYQTCLNPILCV